MIERDAHSRTFSENWKAWRLPCDECVVTGNTGLLCGPHAVESMNRFPCAACGVALKYSEHPGLDPTQYTYCKRCKTDPPVAWTEWLETQ